MFSFCGIKTHKTVTFWNNSDLPKLLFACDVISLDNFSFYARIFFLISYLKDEMIEYIWIKENDCLRPRILRFVSLACLISNMKGNRFSSKLIEAYCLQVWEKVGNERDKKYCISKY